MNTSYITSAQKAKQLPQFNLPEVAFIGRSNCGKSSLLNTLLERKNLARSSSTPGRTQMINFFSVSLSKGQSMIFSDLPGYGFNVAAKEVRKHWDELMAAYLQRADLCELVYLIDVRRKFEDFEFLYMAELAKNIPLLVVLTKIDKVKKKEVQEKKRYVEKTLKDKEIAYKDIFPISNLKKTGISKLRDLIFQHMTALIDQ